jgi:polyphosphate glucokinase
MFGIDIGGSGVKGAPVDVAAGALLVPKRYRIPTPQPSTPDAVLDVAAQIAAHFDWHGPIGCAVPAVVTDGITRSAANIDPSWIGTDARSMLQERTGCDVVMLNDADAAGIAEMRFGAGRNVPGVVLLLTLGTGIGSALFVDGTLVPNTELGHLEFDGDEAEHQAAARLVEEEEMDLEPWARTLDRILRHMEHLFTPNLIILGGGISKRADEFLHWLHTSAPIVPALLRNQAGIIGAATAASETLKEG